MRTPTTGPRTVIVADAEGWSDQTLATALAVLCGCAFFAGFFIGAFACAMALVWGLP